MKINKFFRMALVATMASFTACSNDTEEMFLQEDEIKLTSEITPSRVTSLDYQSTQIVEGQQVGVIVENAKRPHTNVMWTVGNNGALINSGQTLYWGDGEIVVTAYHPFNANWVGSTQESSFYINETVELFTVSTDQSIDKNYVNSDLLWVKETANKTTNAIPLTFTHKLAKISVTLISESSTADLSDATIYVCGTNIETNFNPLTGELSDVVYANVEDIKAGITTDEASTASAIIVPQTIAKGKEFIKVVQGTKIYYYTLPSDKTFEAGKSYSYTLEVKGKKEVTLVSSKITNWTDEEIEGAIDEKYSRLTVTLSNAGTLNEYLNESNKYDVSELKIIGEINAKDVQLIRDFAVGDSGGRPTAKTGALSVLDLSEAKIVAGGGTYTCITAWNNKDGSRNIETRDNVVTEGMFEYTTLKEVILPNTITEIAHSAFEVLPYLTKFVVPEGVKTIGEQAFNTCFNFKSIILPESVETIGSRAFDDCDKMIEITIPSKVTELSSELFKDCI